MPPSVSALWVPGTQLGGYDPLPDRSSTDHEDDSMRVFDGIPGVFRGSCLHAAVARKLLIFLA
jgi:hypothetical protein